jgi:rubrerythrin
MMTATVEELLSAFFSEMQKTLSRYTSFIPRAEVEGHPQLAKLFRAVVASETARGNLFQIGMASHASDTRDYYVCPHCGLVFTQEAPDQCPVDDTSAAQFEKIS